MARCSAAAGGDRGGVCGAGRGPQKPETGDGLSMKKDGRGYFFAAVCRERAGGSRGGDAPPMKGEAGLIGSAARYEYVHSPSEHKNKFSPLPQTSMQNERKRGIVSQTRNKSTYSPPMRELYPE